MSKQPESLRLADALQSEEYFARGPLAMEAAAELRRLHEVNAELVEALQSMLGCCYDMERNDETLAAVKGAMKAIYKATGEQP